VNNFIIGVFVGVMGLALLEFIVLGICSFTTKNDYTPPLPPPLPKCHRQCFKCHQTFVGAKNDKCPHCGNSDLKRIIPIPPPKQNIVEPSEPWPRS
jgi:hypothetical protein